MLNWDHFRYMIAIADNGSASKAAMALNVSHATVLRAINRLEKELQMRLFDHVKTGYRLTTGGEEILINARVMQNNVQQVIRKAKSKDSIPGGPLNIAIPDSTLFNIMPLIKNFSDSYDQITINTSAVTVVKPADFIEQQIDVLVLVSNNPPEALVGRQLGHIKLGVYTATEYSLPQSQQSSKDQHWITWSQFNSDNDELYRYQQQTLLQKTGSTKVIVKTDSHADAIKAVTAGLGASILSHCAATEQLQEIPQSARLRDWGIWVLTHPDFRNTARVTSFMRYLAQNMKDPTPDNKSR